MLPLVHFDALAGVRAPPFGHPSLLAAKAAACSAALLLAAVGHRVRLQYGFCASNAVSLVGGPLLCTVAPCVFVTLCGDIEHAVQMGWACNGISFLPLAPSIFGGSVAPVQVLSVVSFAPLPAYMFRPQTLSIARLAIWLSLQLHVLPVV